MAKKDFTQLAKAIIDKATGKATSETRPQKAHKPGPSQGGLARARLLTAKRRKEIARQAAKKRWELK